jgi:preprotein translocase subunit SecE
MQRLKDFFKNVNREMRKVSWPSRRELLRYTWVVLGTMAFFIFFFAIVDYGISSIMKLILE